jgi:hypothetical protein
MKKLLVAACAANMLGSVCVASAGQLETVPQILQDRSPWCRKAECITFGPKELVWLSVDTAIAKYPPPLCSIFRIDDELPLEERQELQSHYKMWTVPRPQSTYRIQYKCEDGRIDDEIFLLLSSDWMLVGGKAEEYRGYWSTWRLNQ